MKKTSFLSLGLRDFLKGLVMAVLGAVFGIVQGSVEASQFVFNWNDIWHAAVIATVAYLAKNFFTNSKDEFLTKEKK